MKNNATNSPVLTLVYGAAIAAIYVVLTMVFPADQLWTDPV